LTEKFWDRKTAERTKEPQADMGAKSEFRKPRSRQGFNAKTQRAKTGEFLAGILVAEK
jgi:hypothetical protein